LVHEAIILAGGLGTRLREAVSEVPKSMAPVNGRPFLDYLLAYLAHHDVRKVILAVGYKAGSIITHYGEKYDYSVEDEPLGTGGAVRQALGLSNEKETLVLNGDSFFDIDFKSFCQLHAQAGADCSLALRRTEDAGRYGTVITGPGGRINRFHEKNESRGTGLINGGIYLVNRQKFLDHTPAETPFSLEKDFFEKKAGELKLFGFEFEDYFIDIGIKKDYEKAQNDFTRFAYQ
jgi:D-glycero-alpha-D-manno-heptose 1-phosphate guanylyltransferase